MRDNLKRILFHICCIVALHEDVESDTYSHLVDMDVVNGVNGNIVPKNYSVDRDAFIKSADGYMVMYSIDVAQSFHEIWQYKDQVMSLRKEDAPVFPVVLAGNKSDLDLVREVMQKDALDLASTWGSIPTIEVSSKDHASVENMYHTMVREMRKFRKMSALQKRQKADQCSVM